MLPAGNRKAVAETTHGDWLQQQLAQIAARQQRLPEQENAQLPWACTHEHHFNPADCGSYPYRQKSLTHMWRDLVACHQAIAQAVAGLQHEPLADGADPQIKTDPSQDPFGWVPEVHSAEGGQMDSRADGHEAYVRPRTAQIRSKTATSLDLELFDSPEMEQVDIPQQLHDAIAAGAPGIEAVSRFYSTDGSFTWAPCTVLQHDR